jgi:hypothetical protein
MIDIVFIEGIDSLPVYTHPDLPISIRNTVTTRHSQIYSESIYMYDLLGRMASDKLMNTTTTAPGLILTNQRLKTSTYHYLLRYYIKFHFPFIAVHLFISTFS